MYLSPASSESLWFKNTFTTEAQRAQIYCLGLLVSMYSRSFLLSE